MRGGGWGFTGSSSIPGVPGTVSNPQVFTAIGDCRATEPGSWIPQSSYANYQKGLPGMSGGRRSRRRSNRSRRRGQKGGRYTFDLTDSSVAGVSPNGAAWWAGTYPPVQRIACEGSTPNPLNPGPHTPSTQPTPVASSQLHLNPQSGGAPNTVGVGDVDSMYYYAPTAGYDNKPSTWVDSVGAPVQLQIPFAAREMNPACLTTGHPAPLTGALQKGGSLFNTLKNSLKKVSNTVGLTKKNNNLSGVGNAYTATNTNVSEYPPLPNSPTPNLNANTNTNYSIPNTPMFLNSNSNSNNGNSNINNAFANSVGGKRKRKASKKSRKVRKH